MNNSVIAETLYNYLVEENILPEDQKGCRKGKGELTTNSTDKTVLRDSKRRHANLAMVWINYREVYNMVPHSWIVEYLKLFGVAVNVQNFLIDSMKTEVTPAEDRKAMWRSGEEFYREAAFLLYYSCYVWCLWNWFWERQGMDMNRHLGWFMSSITLTKHPDPRYVECVVKRWKG